MCAAGMVVGVVGFVVSISYNDTWPGVVLVVVGCALMVWGRWLADRPGTQRQTTRP